VYTHAVRVLENDEGQALSRDVTGADDHDDLRIQVTNVICAMCIALPTALVHELDGFDTTFDVLEDWEMWLRASQLVRLVHVPVPTAEYRMRQGRGNSTTREFFRFHDALERIYRKHPVPSGSPAEGARAQMLAGSEGRKHAYGFQISVVIACTGAPDSVLPTLMDVARVLEGSEYEVLMLVPSVGEWEPVLAMLSGDVQTYAVGDVSARTAWDFASARWAGEHVLLLRSGEVLDPRLTAAALRRGKGTSAAVGIRPALLAKAGAR
jgi:hypothetical protein